MSKTITYEQLESILKSGKITMIEYLHVFHSIKSLVYNTNGVWYYQSVSYPLVLKELNEVMELTNDGINVKRRVYNQVEDGEYMGIDGCYHPTYRDEGEGWIETNEMILHARYKIPSIARDTGPETPMRGKLKGLLY